MLKYKRNRKLIQLTCDNCGKLYDKPITEYNRNIRLKRHNFCSRSCAIKYSNKINKRKGNPQYLIADNRKVEMEAYDSLVLIVSNKPNKIYHSSYDINFKTEKKFMKDSR